jgi:hypothetical protein
MHRLLLAMAVLMAGAGAASACTNDSELPWLERQFRSSYKNSPQPEWSPGSQYAMPVAAGTGVTLLVGAFLIVSRKQASETK